MSDTSSSGGRSADSSASTPSGNTADKARNDDNLARSSTENSHPSPSKDGDKADYGSEIRRSVEGDARAEFGQSTEGHEKGDETSGSPHVGPGKRTATFENDAGD